MVCLSGLSPINGLSFRARRLKFRMNLRKKCEKIQHTVSSSTEICAIDLSPTSTTSEAIRGRPSEASLIFFVMLAFLVDF